MRPTDLRLATLPFKDLMQDASDDGGLRHQLTLFDAFASDPADTRAREECLFDDESDAATDRRQMSLASSAGGTIRRAHAVTRDDDDLLPAF